MEVQATQTEQPELPLPGVITQEDPPVETVSRAEFERVQADMMKYKNKSRDAEAMAERLKMQGFKEKDDWKKVAEELEVQNKELKTAHEGLQSAIVSDRKMSILKLEAKKAGILDSALEDIELVDFPEIQVETTSTGKLNVLGADRAVQRLKSSRPHWFSRGAPNINANGPDVTMGGRITYEELEKLRLKATGSHRNDSPEWKEYGEKLRLYQSQK